MDSNEEGFKALQDAVTGALVSAVRAANTLGSEDLSFHRSFDPAVATAIDRQRARLLALAEQLLTNATAGTHLANPKLPDEDAVDTRWRGIVDVVDNLLERADMCLDEHSGAVKRDVPDPEKTSNMPTGSSFGRNRVPRNLDIPKPQKSFENVQTNQEKDAFKPLLTSKPHAIVPLDEVLERRSHNYETGTQQYDTQIYISQYKTSSEPFRKLIDSDIRYEHPYKTEIEQSAYPEFVHTVSDPIAYHPFESTSATWVDTPEALNEMLAELKEAKEIAIDLEAHDTRSYVGIVCLMQISTRTRDWIVDTLKPWRRRLECLNEVFADPKIIKVLHGATSDVIWLQSNLGLYIVGLFDTHHASRALRYKGGSLAFLLDKFVDFQAQKQYQTADWRIRPIPQEMLDYARSDTHFLLYVFDNMRNELIENSDSENDLIGNVLTMSKETALQRYEHPMYDTLRGMGPMGWYRQLARTPALFTKEQFAVFRAVHKWRDDLARMEDDSLFYTMSHHALFAIAREMPSDRASMFSVAAPVSQPVRLRIDELVGLVQKARAEGAMGPEMHSVMTDIEKFVIEHRPQRQIPRLQKAPAPVSGGEVSTAVPVVKRAAEALTRSRLWGAVFGSHRKAEQTSNIPEVCLELPLPDLTAEVFEPMDTEQNGTAASKEHEFVKAGDRQVDEGTDDVFIVKQLGGKRKRTHEASTDGVSDQHPTSLPDVSTRVNDKGRRKAEKRAAKEAKRAQQEQEQHVNDHEEVEPFDYANAPSVLNAPQPKAKQDRRFDVYTRGLDTAKGLPRGQKQRAGKSQTFKK